MTETIIGDLLAIAAVHSGTAAEAEFPELAFLLRDAAARLRTLTRERDEARAEVARLRYRLSEIVSAVDAIAADVVETARTVAAIGEDGLGDDD